ncbi:C40 family peptidase [Streptomyces wuyuanensis]|uniref:C40 family peptidase n=1 Tax=Streptomyces wuyuanensis TaxID=1196353 RepID=UPI0034171B7B
MNGKVIEADMSEHASWTPCTTSALRRTIGRHRKPNRTSTFVALRASIVTSVLGAVAATTIPAEARSGTSHTPTDTITQPLQLESLRSSLDETAEATAQAAHTLALQAKEDKATALAATQARKAKAAAERKVKAAARKAKAEAARIAQAKSAAARKKAATTASATSQGQFTTASTQQSPQATTGGAAAAVVNFAHAQLGKPYVLGGTTSSAWDCSGLVLKAFEKAGISLPRVAKDQVQAGRQVSLQNLQPGDILYWGSPANAYHVAIYIGGGEFIGAQNPRVGVAKRTLTWDQPSGAVRVLP